MSNQGKTTITKRNWWKVAFFAMLIAFELAREIAVVEAASTAQANVQLMVWNHGAIGNRYINATGSWRRNDGGDKLAPTAVAIHCREEQGECIEVTSTLMDKYVFAPDMNRYPAQFGPDGVTYLNEDATCARYQVRVDLKLQQVFALRQRKNIKGDCARIEPRMALQLAAAPAPDAFSLDGHFVPLIKLIAAIG